MIFGIGQKIEQVGNVCVQLNSDLYPGPDWLKKEQINYKTWALKPFEDQNNLYQPKYHINYIIIILQKKRLHRDVVTMLILL